MGCRTGDGPPLEAGPGVDGRHRPRVARSSPRGQEAVAGHRVHARTAETGAALSRADRVHAQDLGLSARLAGTSSPAVALWQTKVRHDEPLIERVIAQSERRVLCGEAVPARDKLVSLFESHADIIVKGSRDVQYGHKLNLTA